MAEYVPADVDAVLTRLFALLGVVPPRQGSVVFDFHEGRLQQVRPTTVIRIRRDTALETDPGSAHTQRRT